jgi:NAD(P)-dependent dehydrogenase (short-subunit alcohol dehydrogenase family)
VSRGAALYIVTGSSRGLGAAIAEQLLQPGHRLLCMARRANDGLAELASRRGASLEQWQVDLAAPATVAARLDDWLCALDGTSIASAALINNAGVLSRMGPIDATTSDDLANALRVGLEAPMLLTASFLRQTRGWAAPRKVLNISSGLGRRAMAGSASYCAAKAGLDHFSRCTALDEAARPNGARIVSLAPGVIDTDMQSELRAGDPADFPDRANFVNLKTAGQLVRPAETAARVLGWLDRANFGETVIGDVREA